MRIARLEPQKAPGPTPRIHAGHDRDLVRRGRRQRELRKLFR